MSALVISKNMQVCFRVLIELGLPDADSIVPPFYALITPCVLADLNFKSGQSIAALIKPVSLSQG